MKKLSLLLVLSALLIAGCTRTETTVESNESTGESRVQEDISADEMKKEVGEAWDATTRYFTRERDRVRAEISEATEKLDRRIDELKAERGRTADEGKRDKLEIEIRGLEDERARLAEMGGKVKNATQSAWQDIKNGWNELRQSADERIKADEPDSRTTRQ